ncbi:MAG: carboxypeptidase regulatory-like domain-containing protein, partial [Delftia sp.]|nr:carboxypeptidase regulatory-like domain-containing protein [Delftia sp.]
MSKWLTITGIRHQAAIAGRVSDAQTGAAIAGSQVVISAGPETFQKGLALKARQYGESWDSLPERPDRAYTAADGYYRFINLPPGDYALTALLPGSGTRYGQAQASVNVSCDD